MEFQPTSLQDAVLVSSIEVRDERGYFARLRCSREFGEYGMPTEFVQTNLSFNKRAGTFRGLHYQAPPSVEGKLVRCLAGAIDDVIVDLRPDSASFLKHAWFGLSEKELTALYVPSGFAHGFRTCADDTLVLYEMTDFYAPSLARGICWDDPALGIEMPGEVNVINRRDSEYSELQMKDLECFRC